MCVCVECVRPKAPRRLAMGIPQQQQQQQQVNDSKDYSRFFLCQVCFWAWKPHKSYCFSTSLSFKRAKLHTASPTVALLHPTPPHPSPLLHPYLPFRQEQQQQQRWKKSVFVYGFILHARFKCLPLPRPLPTAPPLPWHA